MKKWIAIVLVLLLALLGYLAAGPYLAIRGINASLRDRDFDQLERHVDFPRLRANMRGQIESRLTESAGELGGAAFGGAARELVGQISGRAVNAMVTPAGIAILLEGRSFARRVSGATDAAPSPDAQTPEPSAGYQPLKDATTRFESPTRFTATTDSADGSPVVFVFQLQGLHWRLTDIRLPQ